MTAIADRPPLTEAQITEASEFRWRLAIRRAARYALRWMRRIRRLEQVSDAEVDAAIQAAATQLHGEDATKWPAPVLMACVVRSLEVRA